jgi:hypothetical protein
MPAMPVLPLMPFMPLIPPIPLMPFRALLVELLPNAPPPPGALMPLPSVREPKACAAASRGRP